MTELATTDLALWEAHCRRGEVDPISMLQQCQKRIEADHRINAVLAHDPSGAERAAIDSANRWRTGAPLSLIDGAPILVKANIAVAGLPWHAGIAAYAGRIAHTDASIVKRLRFAGAVILGLANMDEAALGADGSNHWYGRVSNPVRAGASAGGSSGGSAAAVAAGLCMAALGSDTIGSIAIPAAYCGVVGHRASRKLVSTAGIVPLSRTYDHGGWHAGTVGGAIVLGKALNMGGAHLQPLRIAALTLDRFELDQGCEPMIGEAAERLRALGWNVDRIALPVAIKGIAQRLFEVAEAEGAAVHQQTLAQSPEGFSPQMRRMLNWGACAGAGRLASHLGELAQIAASIRAAIADYDALLLPAAPNPPYEIGSLHRGDQALFGAVPACLGWPATTIPSPNHAGLAHFVTASSDAMCLRIAEALSP